MTEATEYQKHLKNAGDDAASSNAGRMHEAAEQVRQLGNRAGRLASDSATRATEHPYMTLAIAAGLAFAVGALWKLRAVQQRQSRVDMLMSQLSELGNTSNLWPRRWR